MTHYTSNDAPGTSDWIFGMVKRNPEGLLLSRPDAALLMRSGSRPSQRADGRRQRQWRPSEAYSQSTSSLRSIGRGGRKRPARRARKERRKVGRRRGRFCR